MKREKPTTWHTSSGKIEDKELKETEDRIDF